MKHSQTIGIIAALLLVVSCFLPWITISINDVTLVLNGYFGKVNDSLTFGKQYIPHSFFCAICIVFFLINTVWAKRANMLFTLLNLSWAIKNFIVFGFCRPQCPTKQIGIYALVVLAGIMLLMSLLPKMEVTKKYS